MREKKAIEKKSWMDNIDFKMVSNLRRKSE